MAKFLFVVPPFMGHINPTLGIGAELLQRGHEVVWVGLKDIPHELIPENGKFLVPFKQFDNLEKQIFEIAKAQDHGATLRSLEVAKFVMDVTYIPFCNIMVGSLLKVIDEFKPDIILHDENMFAGPICATLRNIPYVTSIAVPPGLFIPSGYLPKFEAWQTQRIIALQQKHGIPGEDKIVYSKDLNFVYSSKEFLGQHSFPEHYKFVGPIIKGRLAGSDFNWQKLRSAKSPKVYVSLGTVLNDIRKEFFTKVIDDLADLPITVIVATDPAIFDKWPDNFIVQSYVPQSELLQYVDAIIYHGGFNTVNESLLNGIPMLIIPMAFDQFHIAGLVVNCGAGLRLKYKRMRQGDIREALLKIMNDKIFKESAIKIGKTLRDAGGTDQAATHLEVLARRYSTAIERNHEEEINTTYK